MRRLPQSTRDAIQRLLADGYTHRQIRDLTGASLGIISRIRREGAGAPQPTQRPQSAPASDLAASAATGGADFDEAYSSLIDRYLGGADVSHLTPAQMRRMLIDAERVVRLRQMSPGVWYSEADMTLMLETWHTYCRDAFVRSPDDERLMNQALEHFNGWLASWHARRSSL